MRAILFGGRLPSRVALRCHLTCRCRLGSADARSSLDNRGSVRLDVVSYGAESARWADRGRALIRRAEERVLSGRGILANRHVAGKLLPFDAEGPYVVSMKPREVEFADGGLPVPPKGLWQRWGLTLDSYLEGGRRDVETMLETVAVASGVDDRIERILDFGCAEGRMLRHLHDSKRELWGVDINAERVAWGQQHLSPPLRFATTSTAPHLPFSDGYFDLIYAVSVFTHIGELGDAWFLELLRVARPGGHIYLTIHDDHSVDVLLNQHRADQSQREMVDLLLRFDAATGTLGRDWLYFAVYADPGAQVFYRRDELVKRWSQLAELCETRLEAVGYQTALTFRKPPSPY
jgi:SAM-dependent methyltransferase